MLTALAIASLLYWIAMSVVVWKTIAGVPAVPPLSVLVLANLLLVVLEGGFLAGPLPLLAATWALAFLTSLRLAAWLGLPRWPSAIPMLGMALLTAAIVRSGALALVRGGVLWRGTLYPTRLVRSGRRLGIVPTSRAPNGP